ncbi:hypothetical protein B0W47_17345 (plasmid) [Komagataeibacter nataicola]|uniref:Uncharacterized protein n=1 Tax=Komagataeibacter nataicola TaxID=265960 RepID=A0A9N7CQV1_9PROT|nr:hypothetical protein B0W47_17345 [Komagataeibacter nataicola]
MNSEKCSIPDLWGSRMQLRKKSLTLDQEAMMPGLALIRRVENFNFRIDPALKAAFTAATSADERPAADVLRDFMRAMWRAVAACFRGRSAAAVP